MLINKLAVISIDISKNFKSPSNEILSLNESEDKYINHIYNDLIQSKRTRECELEKEGVFSRLLSSYRNDETSFNDICDEIQNIVFNGLFEQYEDRVSDILISDFEISGTRQLIICEKKLEEGFIHKLEYDGDAPQMRILNFKAILNTKINAQDRILLINLSDDSTYIYDLHKSKQTSVFENIFGVSKNLDSNDIVKIIEKEYMAVAITQDENTIEKSGLLKTKINTSQEIDMEKLPDELFKDSLTSAIEFKKRILEKKLPTNVKIDHSKLTKKNKFQKLITESGIEILVPVEHLKDKRKIELINNPDGTISIHIENISKLINR